MLVSGLDFPSVLAVDPTHAYVLASHAIYRVSIDGDGGAAEPWFDQGGPVEGLAVDDSSVFTFRERDHALLAVPKNGGAPKVLATLPDAFRLAVDATDVFVASGAGVATITRVPKGGGPAVTLVGGLDFASSVATEGGVVWFVEYGKRRIGRVPKGGGDVTWVTTRETTIHDFKPYEGGVAWIDTQVRAMSADAKEPVVVDEIGHEALTVRDGVVYWAYALGTHGGAFARPLAGGSRVKIADCPERVEAMAADARYLYLAERGAKRPGGLLAPRSGRLLRMAR